MRWNYCQLSKQMRQKHLLFNLMGGDSTANTCQQALETLFKAVLSQEGASQLLWWLWINTSSETLSFDWVGHLEDKSGASGLNDSSTNILLRLNRWILKDATVVPAAPRRLWFHVWEVCRLSRESSLVFQLVPIVIDRLARWWCRGRRSHITSGSFWLFKLGLHVLQVFSLSCLNTSRNFSFILPQTTRDTCQLQMCLEGYSWRSDASACMCWLCWTPKRSTMMAWWMLCFVSSESCLQVSVTEESPEPEAGAPGTCSSAPLTHQSAWFYGFT